MHSLFLYSPFFFLKQHSFLACMVLIIQENYSQGENLGLSVNPKLAGRGCINGCMSIQSANQHSKRGRSRQQAKRLMAKTTIHFAKVFAAHIESLSGCLTACLPVTRFVTPVGCASIQLCAAAAAVGRVRRMLASSHEMNAQRQYLKYQLVCLCRAISKRSVQKKKK